VAQPLRRHGVGQPGVQSVDWVSVRRRARDRRKFASGKRNICQGLSSRAEANARTRRHRLGNHRALDAVTGEKRWEFRLHSAPWAGVLATAAGSIFSGADEGNFFALDAANGTPLWDFQTGGPIASSPISFTIDGRQHVAIAADRVLFVLGC